MIEKNDPRLTDFVLGELNEADTAEIQNAMVKSPELKSAIEEIRQTVELLGAAYQTEEPLRLLDEQKAELSQTHVVDAAGELKRASSSTRPWLPIALAASLLGLLIGGAIYLQNPPLDPAIAKRIEQVGKLDNAQLDHLKSKSEENDKLAKLVADYNQSIDDGKFADAQRYAIQASEMAPDSQLAAVLTEKGKLVSELSKMESLGEAKASEHWSSFADAKKSGNILKPGNEPVPTMKRPAEFLAGGEISNPSTGIAAGKAFREEDGFQVDSPASDPNSINSFAEQGPAQAGQMADVFGSGGIGGSMGGGGRLAGELDELHPMGGYSSSDFIEEELIEEMPESEIAGGRLLRSYGGMAGRGGVGGARAQETSEEDFESMNLNAHGRIAADQNRPGPAGIPKPADDVMEEAPLVEVPLPTDSSAGNDRPTGLAGPGDGDSKDDTERRSGSIADSAAAKITDVAGLITAPDIGRDETIKNEAKKIANLEKKIEQLGLGDELGLSLEMRMVPLTKSRIVPVQRTRVEERTREVQLKDGSTGVENYQITVPYTEQVTQSYTVEVPQQYLFVKPEKTRELVENLARRYDPNGVREFGLQELFDSSVEELEQSRLSEEEGKQLSIAKKLRDEIALLDGRKDSGLDASPVLEQLNKALEKRNAKVRQARTWKRVKAIPNTTRLMVGDKDELDMSGMQVNVQVDGFRARVLIDCFYYNDRGQQLEGNFKLRLPDDASLYYFAFGESAYDLQAKGQLAAEEFLDDGTQFVSLGAPKIREARKDAWENVKEARMVPREQAAHAYQETVRRKVDPALVEWSGAGVFNARVFPLAPQKLHRIVIGYDVNLTRTDGDWVYQLDLPEQTGQCKVDLNVQPIDGVEYQIEPAVDPTVNEVGGKTQRRYRFNGPQENGIRLTANQSPEVLLVSNDKQEGEFWGMQLTPDLPVEQVAGNPQAIFLVDTSLSSNPDKFNVWLKLLESTLETNRGSLKQFNVVFFNVDAHFWQERWVDNTQENVVQLMKKCDTLALEGATDLYGAIEKVTQSQWIKESRMDAAGKRSPGPDLFLFSDGAANWGETNLRLIGRQMDDHHLGSLFAYQTGLTGTAISGLRFLAGNSGGAVFSVASEDEIKSASTAHRKRPWKLTSISAAGATDLMTAGRVQWVYPGQSITLVGRGNVDGELKLELEQAGQTKTISVTPTRLESELASRLYGQIAVGQLESLGAKVFDVAASYARHFRVTGDTCSLLMLESEADYERFDIKPQEDLFVIKTKAAKKLVAETLKKSAADLADPKAQLLAWMQRLETMPGMSFKMPTALKLAMDEIQVVAISKPLDCSLNARDGLSREYLAAIEQERLDYELIAAEANRRGGTSIDDAIKVFSSLIERNPGDLVIARDVAYTALELGRPAQAYHLLRNVAKTRPFEGSIYPALGQCLAQLGQADMAIVYYEIALEGTFNRTGADFKKIVSAEYLHLLRQIVDGDLESSVKDFAQARMETLTRNLNFESANLLITMMWNTDQTDVDLHVFEPSGEECSYENKSTRSGGNITADITTGFGPEMYFHPKAPNGKYDIQVKYFASDQNRTELRNKVHLTIYRGFGTSDERVTRKTIQLKKVGEKESVATVGVDD